jgi:hypothetical protein
MTQMIRRMLAHDADDGNMRPAGVMQIGEAVAQTRPEMKERTRRPLAHPRVSVCGAGDDSLEETEHTPHFRNLVQSRDDMYFRGARVGEASIDIPRHQRANQTLCAVDLLQSGILSLRLNLLGSSIHRSRRIRHCRR